MQVVEQYGDLWNQNQDLNGFLHEVEMWLLAQSSYPLGFTIPE
jgi:hypothetical protein